MQTPSIPTKEKVESYVLFRCINILSDDQYARYVVTESKNGLPWATDMIAHTNEIQQFFDFWTGYMDLMAKRNNTGISKLCSQLQHALPIAREYSKFALEDCAVTRLRSRPCFEILSNKDNVSSITAHHSILTRCQSLWVMYHVDQILGHSMQKLSEELESKTLMDVCSELRGSEIQKTLVQYLLFVFDQVHSVFTEENCMQHYTTPAA
jgi:hypothetical protein